MVMTAVVCSISTLSVISSFAGFEPSLAEHVHILDQIDLRKLLARQVDTHGQGSMPRELLLPDA